MGASIGALGGWLKQKIDQTPAFAGQVFNGVTGIPAVYNAARLGAAQVTGNQKAAGNATMALNNTLPNVWPIAAANSFKNGFGQDIATAVTAPYAAHMAQQQADYARRMLGNNTGNPVHDAAVEAYANQVQNNMLNQHLRTAGIDQSTTPGMMQRKVGADAAAAATNIAMASSLPGMARAPILKVAGAYGGLNAANSMAGVMAANPNARPMDYVKAGAGGFAQGAAFPLAIHGAMRAAPYAMRGAQAAGQAVQNGVDQYHAMPQAVREGGYIQLPGADATRTAAANVLARQAKNAGDFANQAQQAGLPPMDHQQFFNQVRNEMQLEDQIKQTNPNLIVKPEDTPQTKTITLQNINQQSGKEIQDTGNKMFGSRKDLAKLSTIDPTNLGYIESQGDRVANNFVTKQRVLGDQAKYTPNVQGDPALENYRNVVLNSIPTRPTGSAQARAMFVSEIPGLVQQMKAAPNMEAARQVAANYLGDFNHKYAARDAFGAKFFNVLRGNSDAVRNAIYRPPADFGWAQKTAPVKVVSKQPVPLHGGPLMPYDRVGGNLLTQSTPEAIRNGFNLKGFEYGNYVKDAEAKAHLERVGGALTDLSQLTNTDLPGLLQQMQLGVGFGSRGNGGSAIAHYEPWSKVINITKKSGADGSLGHEFAHALDDYLGSGNGRGGYASDGKATNPAVRAAMNDVMDKLREGNSTVTVPRSANPPDITRWGSVDRILERNNNDANAAMSDLMDRYPGTHGAQLNRIAQYLMNKTNTDKVDIPVRQSAFAAQSEQAGDYWKRPTEMFARAFSDYLRAKGEDNGTKNNYLTFTEKRQPIFSPENMKPDVMQAMDNLMGTIKQEYKIGDAPTPTVKPMAEPSPNVKIALPAPLQKLQAQLGDNAIVKPDGTVVDKTGKEMTTGQLQELTQAKYLTDFEHASQTGDIATMDKIAAQHPNDARVSSGSIHSAQEGDLAHNPQAGFIQVAEPPKATITPKEQPAPTVIGKPSRFANVTVQNSPAVSDELKAAVADKKVAYTPAAMQTGLDAADQYANRLKSADRTAANTLVALNKPKGQVARQDMFNALAVADRLDQAGGNKNLDLASQIYEKVSGHATAGGQMIQALASIGNRSSQGIKYMMIKALDKGKVAYDGPLRDQAEGLLNTIKNTEPGSYDRMNAVAELDHLVSSKLPRSKGDAFFGIWRAGLLSGPETAAKVAFNHSFTVPLEAGATLPTAAYDKLFSAFTGKRTATATYRGYGSGFVQGSKDFGHKLATGVDRPYSSGHSDFAQMSAGDLFKGTHRTAYENLMGNFHGGVFMPAFEADYRNSLFDQGTAEAMTQGLKGADKESFIQNFVSNPSKEARQTAQFDAERKTNQQRTYGGQLASNLQQFKPFGVPVGGMLVPFGRIPAALGSTGLVDYTPAGPIAEAVRQLQAGRFDQRTMSQALGRATTGTAVAALGGAMMTNGRMTLKAPDDTKDQALWRLEGKQPNSIYIGGTVTKRPDGTTQYNGGRWISLNAFGAAGITLGTGGAAARAYGDSSGSNPLTKAVGAVPEAGASGARLLMDQPYLKGVSGLVNMLNDPSRYAQNFVDNTAGSFIPAASSQIARGTDTLQRAYPNNPVSELQSLIPGLRERLPGLQNLYGNDLPNNGSYKPSGFLNVANPFYPQAARNQNDPVTQELQRLYNAQGSANSPAIGQPSKSMQLNGVQTKLTPQQLHDYIAGAGPNIQNNLAQLMGSSAYQQLSDKDKVAQINSIIQDARSTSAINTLHDNPKTISQGTAAMLAGGSPVASMNMTIQNKVAVEKFKQSSDKIMQQGDTVFYKDPNGNVLSMPKIEYNFNIANAKLNLAMDSAVASNDLNGWMSLAGQQYNALDQKKALYDPGTQSDKIDAINLQQQNLMQQAEKYANQGYITKGVRVGSSRGSGLPSINVTPPSGLMGPVISNSAYQAPKMQLRNRGSVRMAGRRRNLRAVKLSAPSKI